ncbi:MAG TPA: hypothetical protein VFT02_04095 [Pyrinomonadaceae bacterium]|nr:hypothetical protein [Pyrinomonadaceae bacterium]
MLRTLFVLLAISLPVSAQCTQKIATLPVAPELLGFRLGMTKDDIRALIPQAEFPRADPFGVAKTTINPHFDPKIDQAKYKGVRSISLDLLDGQLTSIWIGYDDTFKIQNVDEFVKAINDSLQLSGRWSSWRSRGQQLRCADFQLIVSTLAGGPSLRLLNVGAEDTIAARRQAKEEQDALAEAAGGEENDEEAPPVIGDKQTKTYYANGCQPTKEIPETNRAVFKSPEQAEKAGFKLAKNCQ